MPVEFFQQTLKTATASSLLCYNDINFITLEFSITQTSTEETSNF